MTKFKIGSVQEMETGGTITKSIHVDSESQRMHVNFYFVNTSEMKELSKRIEKAIKREVNRK